MENTNNTASVVMKTREWPERLLVWSPG
ncbi:conjugal transfer protein, partial [Escherichia coli]